jgi:hypothetical protein
MALVALFVDIAPQQPLLVRDGLARVRIVDNKRVPVAGHAGCRAKPPAARSFSTTWLARLIERDGRPGLAGMGRLQIASLLSLPSFLSRVRR